MSKRRKVKKNIFIWLILPILSGILFYSSFFIYREIKTSIYDGKHQVNIIFIFDEFFLCSYRPKDQSLTILQLPENLYVKVPFSLGDYKISSVWGLSKLLLLEKKALKEGELLKKTLVDNLYFDSNGWFRYEKILKLKKNVKLDGKMVKNLLKTKIGFIGLTSFIPYIKITKDWETNLNTFDLIRLSIGLKNVREDKIFVYNIKNTKILEKRKLNDDSYAYISDKKSLLMYLPSLFGDQEVKNEGLKISIINASGKNGLGAKVADLISVFGGSVIQIKSEEKIVKRSYCEYRSKSITKSYTLKKISNFFKCQLREMTKIGRSDINLIIGDDY